MTCLDYAMKILITGTRCGIGNFLARHFGAAGHEVWGISRHPQVEFQRECADRKIAFRYDCCDISDWTQMAAFRNRVAAAWPHLDVLICCAGIQGPIGPAMSLDPLEWSASVRTNLDGTFYTIRACYELLRHASCRAKVICFSGGGIKQHTSQLYALRLGQDRANSFGRESSQRMDWPTH